MQSFCSKPKCSFNCIRVNNKLAQLHFWTKVLNDVIGPTMEMPMERTKVTVSIFQIFSLIFKDMNAASKVTKIVLLYVS